MYAKVTSSCKTHILEGKGHGQDHLRPLPNSKKCLAIAGMSDITISYNQGPYYRPSNPKLNSIALSDF